MWKIVDYKQCRSRRTCARTSRRANSTARFASAEGSGLLRLGKNTTELTNASISAKKLVKWLRHAARSMAQRSSTFQSSILPRVRQFVQSLISTLATACPSKSNPHTEVQRTMCIVALGIGDFNPHNSRISFLQMATLLALRDVCEAEVRDMRSQASVLRAQTALPCETQSSTEEGALSTSITLAAVSVCIKFYDPLSQPLHHACCHALDIEVEHENMYGVYRTHSTNEYLLMFMPHCPWELFHNSVVANWPYGSTSCDALRRVLWIANSLHAIPLDTARSPLCIFSPHVIACFDVQPIGTPSNSSCTRANEKKKRPGRHANHSVNNSNTLRTTSDDADVVPLQHDVFVTTVGGGSPVLTFDESDICRALSDMAALRVSADMSNVQIAENLAKVSRKHLNIIKKSHEML